MESPGQIPSPTRPQDPVSPSEHPLAPWSPASSPSPFLSLSILISIRLSIRLSHNPVPLTPPVPQSAHAPGAAGHSEDPSPARKTARRHRLRSRCQEDSALPEIPGPAASFTAPAPASYIR